MNTGKKLMISALVGAVGGLAIAVGVMAAGDDDGGSANAACTGGGAGTPTEMMGGMTGTGAGAMLTHMREVLGEDAYQRMVGHMADPQAGADMTGGVAGDQMMHATMAGMVQSMPMGNDAMPPADLSQHHGLPTPEPTATPAPGS